MFESGNLTFEQRPDKSDRISIGIRLKRLTEDASIDRAGMSIADTYAAAMRVLGDGYSYDAHMLEQVAKAWEQRHREAAKEATDISAETAERQVAKVAPDEPKPYRTRCAVRGNGFLSLGIHDGDYIMMEKVSLKDLQPGTLIHVLNTKKGKWDGLGYFESTDDKEFHATQADGRIFDYLHSPAWQIFHVVSVNRTIPIPQRQSDEQGQPMTERESKLNDLRAKLQNIGDDITDSTQRFKLEREIYELEREARADEWPEVINA